MLLHCTVLSWLHKRSALGSLRHCKSFCASKEMYKPQNTMRSSPGLVECSVTKCHRRSAWAQLHCDICFDGSDTKIYIRKLTLSVELLFAVVELFVSDVCITLRALRVVRISFWACTVVTGRSGLAE